MILRLVGKVEQLEITALLWALSGCRTVLDPICDGGAALLEDVLSQPHSIKPVRDFPVQMLAYMEKQAVV